MSPRGFSYIELIAVLSVLTVFSALMLPAYRNNSQTRAAQSATRYLEALLSERKERAAALGEYAGICLGQNTARLYEYHPFDGSVSFVRTVDFSRFFGMPVSFSAVSNGIAAKNPCDVTETPMALTPQADPSKDWSGTVTAASGPASWRARFGPGEMHDSR